jgi:hypothetical protein
MELKQLLLLKEKGESNRSCEKILGIHRNTINHYVRLFRASGLDYSSLCLLERIETNEKLSRLIMEHLRQSKFFPVLLSPKSGQKPGTVDNPWKVDVNIKLESDL